MDDTLAKMRRKDRAVTDEAWIEAMLEQAPWGSLATVAHGRPFRCGAALH